MSQHLCNVISDFTFMWIPYTNAVHAQIRSVTMRRKAHLARSSSQSEHWICFILPPRGFGHLTMTLIPYNKSQTSLVLLYVRIGLFTVWYAILELRPSFWMLRRPSNLLVRVSCNATNLFYCFNQGNSFSRARWTKHKIRGRTRGTGYYLLHRLLLLTV